jgi:hypothetical protein
MPLLGYGAQRPVPLRWLIQSRNQCVEASDGYDRVCS